MCKYYVVVERIGNSQMYLWNNVKLYYFRCKQNVLEDKSGKNAQRLAANTRATAGPRNSRTDACISWSSCCTCICSEPLCIFATEAQHGVADVWAMDHVVAGWQHVGTLMCSRPQTCRYFGVGCFLIANGDFE